MVVKLRRRPHLVFGLLLLGLGVTLGCGGQAVQFSDQSALAVVDAKRRAEKGQGSQLGADGVGSDAGEGEGLFLLTERAHNIMARVDHCASGFSRTYEFGKKNIRLYKGDHNCKGEILQFELNGELYSLVPGTSFDTSSGSVTEFVSSRGLPASLHLVKQLPAVITREEDSFDVRLMQMERSTDMTLVIDHDIFTLSTPLTQVREGDLSELLVSVKRVTRKSVKQSISIKIIFDGDAVRGDDYEVDSDTLTFNYNEHEKQMRVRIINDQKVEDDKVIAMRIQPSSVYSSYGQLFVSIQDDDSPPERHALALWLSSADEGFANTKKGERLSRWNDLSGHNLHALQPVVAWQPRFEQRVFGRLPGVAFAGSEQFFYIDPQAGIGNGGSSQGKSIALVLATGDDIRNPQMLFEQGGLAAGYNLYLDSERLYFCQWNLVAPSQTVSCLSKPVDRKRRYLVIAAFDGSDQSQSLRVGSSETSQGSGLGPLSDLIGGITLGNLQQASQSHRGILKPRLPFDGQLGAVLLYHQKLSNAERGLLASYLNSQFGL